MADNRSKSSGDSSDQKPSGLSVPPNENNQKDDVKKWMGIIGRTEQWRNQLGEKAGWPRFIREFKGDWDLLQQNVDIPLIPINLVFAYVKTEIARLYFRDPWISVNPKRIEDLGASRIAEQLINYQWGEIDLKRQVKLAIMDALIIGHGWVKMGYTAEFGTIESKEKRGPGRPKNEDPNLDTNEFVKSENVFAYHVPYTDVIFDPAATWPPTHNARWMAFKTIKPLSVVKDCGLYKASVVADLKASELAPSDRNVYAQEGKWVAIWEVWDREHKLVKTVSEGVDRYLKDPQKWPVPFDGFPATMVSFNPVPNEPYPLSDIAPWEGQIIELAKMHSIMINHLKRWNRQLMIKAGMVTEEEKAKFKQSVDGAIIEFQGNKEDLFVPPYAAVQQDIYGVWNLTMDIIRNVAGQSETERGGNAKAQTRTLGELRLQLQGSKGRSDEKVDQIEESIAEIARKLLTIMQHKFDLPKIIKIVGTKSVEKAMILNRPSAQGPNQPNSYTGEEQGGKIDSFSVTKDDIHGEMDVDCVAGSTVPLNKENQLDIMEKLTPSLEMVGITPGSRAAREYGREYLRLINITSLDRIMDIADEEAQQPKPSPEEQKVQAEMQQSQMETQAKMQADQQKGQIEIQTNQQKTQLEIASLVQRMKADAQKTMMDMQATKAKTDAVIMKAQVDMKKAQMDLQNDIIRSMLPQPAEKQNGGTPNDKPK